MWLTLSSSYYKWFPSKPGVGGTKIWHPTTTLKIGLCGVMSNVIKDLSMSSSSPIGFEMEWHSSRFEKWYQSQGYEFESQECHCEGVIVRGTTILLSTTTLKTGPCGVMSRMISTLNKRLNKIDSISNIIIAILQ